MTEAIEVAIELALLNRAQDFAATQNLSIALPNILFTPPAISKTAKYLRATLLPADTVALGVSYSATNHHVGYLQLDVFFGVGGGEIPPRRIAADIISYFIRGTSIVSNGFKIDVIQTPKLGPQITSGAWMFLPVRIPYNAFASPA
jgi:Bacteriophage related domain of unknown function